MNSNKVAWNPREPFNFVLANEDFNLYSFDMRNLDKALLIHKVFTWCHLNSFPGFVVFMHFEALKLESSLMNDDSNAVKTYRCECRITCLP